MIYLETYLAPLSGFLARTDVTDIFVNQPQVVWVETLGGTVERHAAPLLTRDVLARLARQIAAISAQGISREHPILSASLPDGGRVQIVAPPATRGELAMAIRKQVSAGFGLQDLVAAGAFSDVRTRERSGPEAPRASYADADAQRLAKAVSEKKNILVSGGTSTGKTTLLNALLKEVPRTERLIVIEDTHEVEFDHENAVGLVAARSSLREAAVSTEDLLNAALRMRPDRIILGELRGPEAFTFMRAANTGHPGSMTTVHADSPDRALEQLGLLVLQSGANLGWQDIIRYVRSTIDVYVHLDRVAGKRRITSIQDKAEFRQDPSHIP